MLCKTCAYPMGQKILEGQTLDICAACGGIWIDRGELGALLHLPKETPSEEQLNMLKKELEWSCCYEGTPNRICPKCNKAMPRHLFAALSGIAIDYCAADGIWFDPGEFDRLIEFVQKGGLQLARLVKWEEALPTEGKGKGKKTVPRVMIVVNRAAGFFA